MKIKCPKCGQKYDGEDEGQYIECASCRCLFLFDSRPRDIFPLSDATELAKRISEARYSGRISSESADLARLLLNLPPGGEMPGSLSEKINFAVPRGYTVKNGNPWRGKGICIKSSDSFGYKRMAELLEVIGAELKKTVSKRCDLLILGDEFSEAQDLIEKAQELNVPVVNIEKFAHMISLSPGIEALFAPSNTDWICREAVITASRHIQSVFDGANRASIPGESEIMCANFSILTTGTLSSCAFSIKSCASENSSPRINKSQRLLTVFFNSAPITSNNSAMRL